jgi:hypothetical protein
MTVTTKCSNCGGSELVEMVRGVDVSAPIREIECSADVNNPDIVLIRGFDSICSGGHLSYECEQCGHVAADSFNDFKARIAALLKKGETVYVY